MNEFEWNKIFAAVLLAGIIAMLASFFADKIVPKKELEQNAITIEGVGETVVIAQEEQKAEPILALLAGADLERGENLSRACVACHSFNQGGPNKIGPNLYDIVENKYAHLSDFNYSDALMAREGVWTYDSLNQFLWKPKTYLPGTKMNYVGLRKPEDRANLIAWLRTLSDAPADLPTAAEIAAEQPPPEENTTAEDNTEAVDG